MYYTILVVLLLAIEVNSSKHRQTIERVRNYLKQSEAKSKLQSRLLSDEISDLSNSNKIGLGYNLLTGSPVCYTGTCQMTGFMSPIFNLNYTSAIPGSCTSKRVPNHVYLDCIPSTSIDTHSETIATIEQLKKSITNRIEVSVGASYMGAAFSYSFSQESRYMIDNIVKRDVTSIYTAALITYVKLSMFELKMQLSDDFRFVIENMPYCELNNADIEEYVRDFIFEYFGFTYVTSVMLGGIAQQNILIDRETNERLVKTGVNTQQQAQISFQMQFGMNAGTAIGTSEETTNYKSFTHEIQSRKATTLGGDPSLRNLAEWSQTVSSNPVIVKFAIRDIFRLLNTRYFPMDRLINNKTDLIRRALGKYLNITDYCYGDCGGNNGSRGTCVATGHFGFGECQCKPQWSGPDCSVPVTTTNKVLHGTICGFDRSFLKVNCEGREPYARGCPQGWLPYNWPTDLTICYKNVTAIAKPMVGTLCGLYVIYDSPSFQSHIMCNNASLSDAPSYSCPPFYQKVTALKGMRPYRNSVCASFNAEKDLPGTICGMQIEGSVDGPTCDGYNPGLRQCPTGYVSSRTMFNAMGYIVCVKN